MSRETLEEYKAWLDSTNYSPSDKLEMIASWERQAILDNELMARRAKALTVSCPRCKAPANTPCTWGTTHGGGEIPSSHTPRFKKASK